MPGGAKKNLRFMRFFGVSTIVTIADYLMALSLHTFFGVSGVIASFLGFFLGATLNYLGHRHITFATADGEPASIVGFIKYVGAVMLSLVVRLLVLVALQQISVLPFWFVLSVAFAASFLCSYLTSLFWVFRGRT